MKTPINTLTILRKSIIRITVYTTSCGKNSTKRIIIYSFQNVCFHNAKRVTFTNDAVQSKKDYFKKKIEK